MATSKIGILTVSDRASRGEYEDKSGPAIVEYLNSVIETNFEPMIRIVSDEQNLIESALIDLVDVEGCCLVVTTGGTGPAKRDVTTEATEKVCCKLLPGFGELMRQVSLTKVATAILSRQTAGIRYSQNSSDTASCSGGLIINLPGQPKAIAECLDAIFAAVPYCIDLIGGPYIETNESRFKTFRPKSALKNKS